MVERIKRGFLSFFCALALLLVSMSPLSTSSARAQALIGSEHFQELFATAGYSALFGAALGTAILPFVPENSVSNLRIVTGGASIGFVLGSALALYGLRKSQSYGVQYFQEPDPQAADNGSWNWDLGTSTGRDVFVRMDSRF